ncbi:MAG: glucohydrolase, partial [Acidobacteria bacterium]
KLMGALYLTLRGTPIMYYGEELGMENNDPKRPEDVKDPIGRRGWPAEKGRDGERTPMQWSDAVNAGFSTHAPWLPVPDSYKTHNVASESKDPNSVLEFYRKVLALRHQNPVLLEGNYKAVNEDDSNVLSFVRSYEGKSVLVALNMSNSPQKPTFSQIGSSSALKSLVATSGAEAKGSEVSLPAFGVFIGEFREK